MKGTIQWVDAETGVDAEIRQYSYLLKDAAYAGQDFSERMNQDSEHIFRGKAEPLSRGGGGRQGVSADARGVL